MIKRFLNDESGQGMTEYILIVALIALAAIVAVRLFGGKIKDLFVSSKDTITQQTDQAVRNR
jgi:pilus assembly protein Flp/PilA